MPTTSRFTRILWAALIGPALASTGLRATTSDSDLPLVIDVRSYVDRPNEGWGKAAPQEHGKVYAIISVEEEKSEEKLIRPVDEADLVQKLREQLNRRGFKETGPGLKPEILITVNYGRGGLVNPYERTAPTEFLKTTELNHAEKLANAREEKLFIRITAWQFPEITGEKIKPKQLWKTIIITDSPDYRDLNQFYPKMLIAGAAFFDRELETQEAQVHDDMPEGKVILGEMRVLKEGEADLPLSKDAETTGKKSGK